MMKNRVDPESPGQGGFTLIEVVASLMILGLGVLAAIQLLSGGLRLTGAAASHTDLVLAAREKMAETLLSEGLKEGVTGGKTEDAGWTVTVSPFGNEAPEFNKQVFKVTVTAEDLRNKGRTFSLTTLKTVYLE